MLPAHQGLVAALPLVRASVQTSSNTSSSSGGIFIIPNYTFFVELILFVIVLVIVAKWILPPIQAALDERQRTVRGALQAADEDRVESDRIERERDAVLDAARSEGRRVMEEARRRADGLRDEARVRADEERQRRVSEALAGFAAERPALRAEALQDIDRLVVAAAEQVLGAPVDIRRHAGIIDAAVEQVTAMQGAGAGAAAR